MKTTHIGTTLTIVTRQVGEQVEKHDGQPLDWDAIKAEIDKYKAGNGAISCTVARYAELMYQYIMENDLT